VPSETIDPPRRRPNVRPGEEQLPAPGWKAHCVAATLRLFVSGASTGVIATSYVNSMNPLVAYAVGLKGVAEGRELGISVIWLGC
jgi:hypothetical protein